MPNPVESAGVKLVETHTTRVTPVQYIRRANLRIGTNKLYLGPYSERQLQVRGVIRLAHRTPMRDSVLDTGDLDFC